MDKITLKNLSFFGTHGVLKEETVLGQKFFVDVVLHTDTQAAGLSDDVGQTVSYADVYEDVKIQVEERRYDLIEALAEQIAGDILTKYKAIEMVDVEIRKPEAPVRGIFDYFAVTIRRSR